MDDATLQGKFTELFAGLPAPVQRAISSSEVEKHLREIAVTNKLHVDQGEKMETQVLLALFGVKPIEQLQENLKKELKVSEEVAATLAADVSRVVFEPIRQELERELEHPEAKEKEVSSVDATRTQMLGEKPEASSQQPGARPAASSLKTGAVGQPVAGSQQPVANPEQATGSQLQATSSVIPATPPPPPPTEKAIRMPASGAYVPGEASSLRRDIVDDPYRETPP